MAEFASTNERKKKSLKLIFIHLDLGIGGAEQLVLQLAKAGQENGHTLELITTRCDPDHCFAAVAPGGILHKNLVIYGNWIPSKIMGMGTAFMSTLRILYLTYQVCRRHRDADVCVVDVLPTSLPLLYCCLPRAATFFYCHFPDQLLLQSTTSSSTAAWLKQFYRRVLDALEAWTMSTADLIVVNSQFTRTVVLETFTRLRGDSSELATSLDERIPVLYPALDTSGQRAPLPKNKHSPVVSLNRFERKKNILLLLHAYQYLHETYPDQKLPPLIVAGGYDVKNEENVEYRGFLQNMVDNFLSISVDFRTDISDDERSLLFQTALTVVYTPENEHFGIVPLEAMYAGTPVVAVNSGGPKESIVDETTGFLRASTPEAFGEALLQLIRCPDKATKMGLAGKQHVESKFGTERLAREFQSMLEKCQKNQRQNRPNYALWNSVGLYFLDAIFAAVAALVLTLLLQYSGILRQSESIFGGLKRSWSPDEL